MSILLAAGAAATASLHGLPDDDGLPLLADVAHPTLAVGWFHTGPQQAFRWTPEAGFTLLPDLPGGVDRGRANGVSADGTVVVGRGFGEVGAERAVRWVGEGPAQELGAPPGRTVIRSEAFVASSSGAAVAGTGAFSNGTRREVFRWTAARGVETLDVPWNASASYFAFGSLADDGTLLLIVYPESGPEVEIYRWEPDGSMVLKASIADGAWMGGLSADGSAGTIHTADGAFRWTEDAGLEPIGELPIAGPVILDYTYALISSSGTQVGGTSNQRPFLWNAVDGIQPLETLLRARGVDLGDLLLESLDTISADGCVAGGTATAISGGGVDWVAELGCGTCRNGIDDDGDGLSDLEDPGCYAADDLDEHDPNAACDNGWDDDNDGSTDFRTDGSGDPGCGAASGVTEEPACQDGWDTDGAGDGVDFDGGAAFWGEPIAAPDPQCVAAWDSREACGLGFEVAPFVAGLHWLRRRRQRRG